MKINFWASTTVWGGAEHYLEKLSIACAGHGYKVTVVLPNEFALTHIEKRLKNQGIGIQRIEMGLKRKVKSFLNALIIMRKLRPDVNHFVLNFPNLCPMAILASNLLCIKTIVTEQAVPPYAYGGPWGRFLKYISGRISKTTICVSKTNRKNLVRFFRVPSNKTVIIPNGVPTEKYYNPNRLKIEQETYRLGLKDLPVIGTLSRIDERKGSQLFPEIAKTVCNNTPDIRICWAGEGPDRVRLEQKIANAGLSDRVRFIGRIEWVAEFLSMIDIFFIPSKYEGLPFAVVEAMAAGKPVVAFDVSGNQDVVERERSGYLIKPFDCDRFAQKLMALIHNPKKRKAMGEYGRMVASKYYGEEAMIENTIRLYEK